MKNTRSKKSPKCKISKRYTYKYKKQDGGFWGESSVSDCYKNDAIDTACLIKVLKEKIERKLKKSNTLRNIPVIKTLEKIIHYITLLIDEQTKNNYNTQLHTDIMSAIARYKELEPDSKEIKKIETIIAKHNFNNIYKIYHFIVSSF